MSPNSLLFIGDSLIEFFDWQHRYPGYIVANYGVAGETVQALKNRLDVNLAYLPQADWILLMVGTNNVIMEDFLFLPYYEASIMMLKEKMPDARISLNSLLPFTLPWMAGDAVERVNMMLKKLAALQMVEYLDVFSLFTDHLLNNPESRLFLEDGVHLSHEGYSLWSACVEERLKGS